jgi:pimeloyl-ACP methyl ester carboxylesterase
MSAQTHETAPTRFVEANGIRFAYRRFGGGEGLPMLFCQHFTGTMDNWDPIVTNTLAQEREVILFDNQGVGSSSGKTPDSVQAMTTDALAFVDALGLKRIDLLGFSLGGMVAQQIVLDRPKLVRYLDPRRDRPGGRRENSMRHLLRYWRHPYARDPAKSRSLKDHLPVIFPFDNLTCRYDNQSRQLSIR